MESLLPETPSRTVHLKTRQQIATTASLSEATMHRLKRISLPTISTAAFLALAGLNIVRTFRHAMWRDELQAFMVALNSLSPLDMAHGSDRHPWLWYALLWVVTRFTHEPTAMQVLHTLLALGVWTIVFFYSPFTQLQKFLILLSYFLFWEYFVISRNYVLIALIAFVFISVRFKEGQSRILSWTLLGLLANTHLLGLIWSLALAATLALDEAQQKSFSRAGLGIYLVLLLLAAATIFQITDIHGAALDSFGEVHRLQLSLSRLNADLSLPIGAFIPLRPDEFQEALHLITDPASGTIHFWNPDPTDLIAHGLKIDSDHLFRMALVFAIPIAACWLVARDRILVFEFALVYFGILLFANLSDFTGVARHHGVLFLAFIAAAWSARLKRPPTIISSWTLTAVLLVSSCSGVLTLASELRPFSEGYNTAAWLEKNNFATSFLVGSRDAQVSTVAGYLGRPVYYLECECAGTYVDWGNSNRQPFLGPQEFGRRLSKVLDLSTNGSAILIMNQNIDNEDLKTSAPALSVVPLKSFTGAVTRENFWIYEVRRNDRR
jgi:hypothetical protein